MKYLIIILILIGCSSDPYSSNQKGCQSGLDMKNGGFRVTYRCATMAEFKAGSDVKNGGTTLFLYYKDSKWSPCEDCK